MKRRKAIQQIGILSASLALLPACNVETWPTYDNIPIDVSQQKLIARLTQAILPQGETAVSLPEPTPHFVLTMINDCYAPEDIQKYMIGLNIFEQYVQDDYQKNFDQLNPEQTVLLFTEISESPLLPKSVKYFLNTTKHLTVQQYTTSEYFMKNHLKFEFVPGRFHGCVPA